MNDQASDPDELILNLLRRDDPAAVSVMFHAHYRHVYNGVRKIVGTNADAQDIAIQLFQAVWEKRHTLNITTPIRKYLLSAAYNRALNHLRNRGRANASLNDIVRFTATSRTAPAPDREIQARELRKLIKVAIAMLPATPRITFLMSRRLGMTYREIAGHLNVTEKAVEKNMTKALRLLRIYLGPYLKVWLILLALPLAL